MFIEFSEKNEIFEKTSKILVEHEAAIFNHPSSIILRLLFYSTEANLGGGVFY